MSQYFFEFWNSSEKLSLGSRKIKSIKIADFFVVHDFLVQGILYKKIKTI